MTAPPTATLAGADPAEAILPTAVGLAVAVGDHQAPAVERILTRLTRDQLYALAVVLAAHVDLDRPVTNDLPIPYTADLAVRRAVSIAAEMFGTTPDDVLSASRARPDLDARAVAMTACHRLLGLSSVFVGAAFDRDHSTVLHACGRVGESARLRRLAQRVAIQCGWDRAVDEEAS